MCQARMTAEELWADLMEGNRRFQAGQPAARDFPRRRAELVKWQRPQVVVLGCADSRVCPSLLFDKNLGDLFVVRTAGNVADPVALGSLEYAAGYLDSPLLVILGHEGCGAVAAAASGDKLPTPNLESIVARIRPVLENLEGEAGSQAFLRLAEQANVQQSARDVLQESPLLQEKVAAGKLTLIKAVYQLKPGRVVRLSD